MSKLDSDLLRTFLAIIEAGTVSGGATRIGRSQSATSLQVKQLEEIVGRPLFHRHGRGVVLTEAGEHLLPVARRVAGSLDAILADLRGEQLEGRLRIGIPDDHGGTVLTRILADFAARHENVTLQVHCASGAGFDAALQASDLDMAVFEVPEPATDDEILRHDTLSWACSLERDFSTSAILPVALFDQDCWWRTIALNDLERTGRRYQVVFTSESTIGVHAAVGAGIAVALLGTSETRNRLAPFAGLGGGHPSYLVLRDGRSSGGKIHTAMRDVIRRAFIATAGQF